MLACYNIAFANLDEGQFVIPTTYDAWRHCIEEHCQIPLTADFVARRLQELEDRQVYSTEQLHRRYGADHVKQLQQWFQRAADELAHGHR